MLQIQTATDLRSQAFRRLARLEGILSVISSLIFLLGSSEIQFHELLFRGMVVVPLFVLLSFSRKPVWVSSLMIAIAFLFFGIVSFEYLFRNHFLFLGTSITVITTVFILIDALKAEKLQLKEPLNTVHRPFWASLLLPLVIFIAMQNRSVAESLRIVTCIVSVLVTFNVVLVGVRHTKRIVHLALILGVAALVSTLYYFFDFYTISVILFILSIIMVGMLNFHSASPIKKEHWYDFFLDHPARNLMATFLFLSIIGTVLLSLPISSAREQISLIDAAFTAVSAVCVTGLAVLDTPNDFSLIGQILLLLLIQIGGLGIMSIATAGIYAAGRRLSLRRERAMLSLMNTNHNDLSNSLILILKFTFISEAIGACILFWSFLFSGQSVSSSFWNGIFTAVSAFCNAGFALFSDNLVSFQSNPVLLITVSFLIILGGISPAVSVMLPAIIKRKKQSELVLMVFSVTAVLLVIGTLAMLVFEWNGVLQGLSLVDKFSNAWFQSVTFRTAGFNSVSISDFSGMMFLVSLFLMFIGGSPGGTAGGIKTTTVAVLFFTFLNSIRGNSVVSLKKRTIPQATVNRAISIFVSALTMLTLGVLLLELTQPFAPRDLLFEATSALATVGLSTGITASLDETGKMIIMFLMYAGRIGPITLFMILSNDIEQSEREKPDARIEL